MTSKKTQLTIKGAFRRKAQREIPDEERDELERETEELRRELAMKQAELFEAERLALRTTRPVASAPVAVKSAAEAKCIVYESKKQDLEKQIKLMAMMTGVEVGAYERGERCCVIFHMQHDNCRPLQHGLLIDMSAGTSKVTKYSLPLGFNIEAIMSEHDNIMHPACLAAFRRCLVAYYDRQRQYESLKELVKYDVKLFRVPDSSHVELRMRLRRAVSPSAPLDVALHLDYRVCDLRTKQTTLTADITDEEMVVLSIQCSVFKKKPMDIAFKECFLEGRGPWECYTYKDEDELSLRKVISQPKKLPRQKAVAADSDDETWLPEDDH